MAKSITDAIGAPSVADDPSTLDTDEAEAATGLWADIEIALNAAILDLETSLKDGVSENFDTLAEVATKLGTLQDAIDVLNGSGAGSVAKSITDAIGAQSVADDPDTVGTDETVAATGLWADIGQLYLRLSPPTRHSRGGDYQTLEALSDAIKALEGGLDPQRLR